MILTVTDILPLVRQLNRAEKLHLMQVLVSELAQEETDLIQPGLEYPVWSPYDAYEAADIMLRILRESKEDPD